MTISGNETVHMLAACPQLNTVNKVMGSGGDRNEDQEKFTGLHCTNEHLAAAMRVLKALKAAFMHENSARIRKKLESTLNLDYCWLSIPYYS
jgi:hypothetical protein